MNNGLFNRFKRWPSVVVLVIGLLASTLVHQQLSQQALRNWRASAELEAAQISAMLQYWLEILDGPVIALAMLYRSSDQVTDTEFERGLQDIKNGEISLGTQGYAYVETDPNQRLIIRQVNGREPYLVLGSDQTDNPELRSLFSRLAQTPEKLRASPVFLDSDGQYKLLLGAQVREHPMAVVLALVNLTELFQDLNVLASPPGLYVFPETEGLPVNGISPLSDAAGRRRVQTQILRIRHVGSEWRLHWRMHSHYQDGPKTGLAWAILIAGVMLSALTALLMNGWLTQGRRARELDISHETLKATHLELEATLLQLQNATEHLMRSEKLAALGALVAGIAHELNTPIGNSLTVATALQDKTRSFSLAHAQGQLRKSTLNEFIEQSNQASALLTLNLQRAAELIGNFKQIAVDQTSSRRRQFDLAELASEVVFILKPQLQATPHRLNIEIPAGIVLDSYPGPLGQVLSNLITNSLIHAFPERSDGHMTLRAQRCGDSVRLDYADDGCGVPVENVAQLFDPFYTTRLGQGGSGLGLHIVHNLVTGTLGGSITLNNQPGSGLGLCLRLPLIAPAEPEPLGPVPVWARP